MLPLFLIIHLLHDHFTQVCFLYFTPIFSNLKQNSTDWYTLSPHTKKAYTIFHTSAAIQRNDRNKPKRRQRRGLVSVSSKRWFLRYHQPRGIRKHGAAPCGFRPSPCVHLAIPRIQSTPHEVIPPMSPFLSTHCQFTDTPSFSCLIEGSSMGPFGNLTSRG